MERHQIMVQAVVVANGTPVRVGVQNAISTQAQNIPKTPTQKALNQAASNVGI
jgi:hypothetical protein